MEGSIYRDILVKSPFGYAFHEVVYGGQGEPEDYVFLDVNSAFEEITGLNRETILGKRVSEVLSGTGSFDWATFYSMVTPTGERYEFRQYVEPLQRWYRIAAYYPARHYFVALFQEITEEMRRIKTLEAQKERIEELSTELEMVFNGAQDAMFLVRREDGEFRYIRNNEAHQRLTGFSLEDIKGKTPVEVAGRETGEAITAHYQRCADSKRPWTYEETLDLPAGRRTWLTTLTPVLENGAVKYLVGFCKDITLQKKADAELKKRLAYEKMIGGVSQLALQEESLEVFLTESLRLMGEGTGASRAYLFEADRGKGTMSNTFEWTAPGITFQKENLQEIPEAEFTWWMDRLKKREVINYRDIEDISDEATKEILRPQEIKSLLVLPVYVKEEYYGFIGFDDCRQHREWSKADVDLLQMAAELISGYILRKKSEEEILYLSYHDNLTGLYNYRFMEEEIRRLNTTRQLPISIIMGDLNGLKLINDAFGHRAGDLLLQKAAEIIKANCRREDIIARWGGDEFVILLPRTDTKAVEEIVRRIKDRCTLDSGGPIKVSIALGYATKNQAEENIWQVLKEAEEWMYRHKLLEGKSYRNAVISTLKATLFEKSTETEEHATRLAGLCREIGKELGLTEKQLDELELLTVLHDIGKVAISESVLLKPGPLTEKEWEEMRKHPEIGYRIAQNTPELASIAEYILCHHERWDGSGYPRGLKGEEIPLLSRILAVADAYDAMTTDRVYRRAMNREEALAELQRKAGTHFDSEVVNALVRKQGDVFAS